MAQSAAARAPPAGGGAAAIDGRAARIEHLCYAAKDRDEKSDPMVVVLRSAGRAALDCSTPCSSHSDRRLLLEAARPTFGPRRAKPGLAHKHRLSAKSKPSRRRAGPEHGSRSRSRPADSRSVDNGGHILRPRHFELKSAHVAFRSLSSEDSGSGIVAAARRRSDACSVLHKGGSAALVSLTTPSTRFAADLECRRCSAPRSALQQRYPRSWTARPA